MNLDKKKRKLIYFILLLIFIIFGYIYLYSLTPLMENKLQQKIINTSTINEINTIEKVIKKNIPYQEDIVVFLQKNTTVRKKLNEELSVFLSEKVKYIFLIFKDNTGKYRYLLDVANPETEPGLLFVPLKEEKYILEMVYNLKKRFHKIHKEINTIGITYYIPIIKNNKTRSILIADFSFQTLKEIKDLIGIIKRSIVISIAFILFILIIAIYYFYKNIILKQRAYKDSLTGVYNRNYLEDIKDIIDLNNYNIMIVDIDFFKNINDTYGHQIGDEILKSVANILEKNLRKEDIIIRYGGEEFLILLRKDRKDKEGKGSLYAAQKVLQAIRDYKYKGINITASIGLNLDTAMARNFFDAIKKADAALYRAKRTGRNKIELYTEHKNKPYDLSLSDLKEIVEKNNITCFYQPIIHLKTEKPVFFEALARINYNGQFLSPGPYIEMMKGTFLYFKFTKSIIEFNIENLKKYPEIVISLNMAPSDFLNDSMIQILTSIETDIVKRLKFELIETEEVRNYKKLRDNIEKLLNHGYEIILDDFGSGYIDFYFLTELVANYLKIDGSIISKMPENEKYYKLVKHLIAFCKDVNKKVVAEFIENENILKTSKELGIEYGQGYYFSKPLPIEKAYNKYFNQL